MNDELLELPDTTSVRDARDQLFSKLEYQGSGGYSKRWFRLKVGSFWVPLPNLPSRIRAVQLHDLHHLATGYGTHWIGEAEIGAWELASGCRGYWTARFLDLSAFGLGLVLSPRRVFRAFVRGRHSSNLYAGRFEESLLGETMGDLRHRLRLDTTTPGASFADKGAFVYWIVLSAAFPLVLVIALWLLIRWL